MTCFNCAFASVTVFLSTVGITYLLASEIDTLRQRTFGDGGEG